MNIKSNNKSENDTSKESLKKKKNKLEKYLSDANVAAPKTSLAVKASVYETKRTYKKEEDIDIDALNKINLQKKGSLNKRLSRFELLERTLLNLPLNKNMKDISSNSIRSIRDKPIYTKSTFIAKYGKDMKEKTMEDIESNFVYDPKSKLVKDETKGFYNSKNGKYYRYLNSEGQELKELEDTVRRENILNNIKQKQKIKKEGKRLSKEEFEKINDKRNEVLFANPTLLAKKKRLLDEGSTDSNDKFLLKKRDLSSMSAKKVSSGKKMNMSLLNKYK
ncbi:hypothetical protein QEN19_001766 [Hanseniaspora menglaensis]